MQKRHNLVLIKMVHNNQNAGNNVFYYPPLIKLNLRPCTEVLCATEQTFSVDMRDITLPRSQQVYPS